MKRKSWRWKYWHMLEDILMYNECCIQKRHRSMVFLWQSQKIYCLIYIWSSNLTVCFMKLICDSFQTLRLHTIHILPFCIIVINNKIFKTVIDKESVLKNRNHTYKIFSEIYILVLKHIVLSACMSHIHALWSCHWFHFK